MKLWSLYESWIPSGTQRMTLLATSLLYCLDYIVYLLILRVLVSVKVICSLGILIVCRWFQHMCQIKLLLICRCFYWTIVIIWVSAYYICHLVQDVVVLVIRLEILVCVHWNLSLEILVYYFIYLSSLKVILLYLVSIYQWLILRWKIQRYIVIWVKVLYIYRLVMVTYIYRWAVSHVLLVSRSIL